MSLTAIHGASSASLSTPVIPCSESFAQQGQVAFGNTATIIQFSYGPSLIQP